MSELGVMVVTGYLKTVSTIPFPFDGPFDGLPEESESDIINISMSDRTGFCRLKAGSHPPWWAGARPSAFP